jgi:hypothetical protein
MYAPEHLIVNVKDAEQWEELIENVGWHNYLCSIFLYLFFSPSLNILFSNNRVSFHGTMDPRECG